MIKLSDISIKTKLIIYSILMIVFISVSISISSYKASEEAIKKQSSQLVSTSVEQLVKRTDLFLRNIHKNAMVITFNRDLIRLLSSTRYDSYEDMYKSLLYSNYIETFNNINEYVQSVYIYDLNHMVYMTSGGLKKDIAPYDSNYLLIEDMFINDKNKLEAPRYAWIGAKQLRVRAIQPVKMVGKPHIYVDSRQTDFDYISGQPILREKSRSTVSFMMPIRNGSDDLLGALVIDVQEKNISYMYEKTSLVNTGDFYIEDPQGTIISSIDKDRIGDKGSILKGDLERNENSFTTWIKGKEYLVTSYISDYVGWRYVSIIPVNELMKENIKSIKNVLMSIAVVTIILFITFTYFFNSFFYKPVKTLINGIRASVKNHGEMDFKVKRKDEIGFIFSSVNDILKENNKLVKEVYEQKIFSKIAELRSLQSQINPHFLYNSLDTAISMIMLNDSSKAAYIIEALIKLFRHSLGKSDEIITVRQEMENLGSYIAVQKIRYLDSITFEMEFNDGIMDCKILKLMLQPLVENSIYHGFGQKKDPGNIMITGEKCGDLLVFIVEDNGAGITEQRLEEIRSLIDSNEFDHENFYALQNINKRVKLYYGDQYGITVESKELEWTRVILTLPALRVES